MVPCGNESAVDVVANGGSDSALGAAVDGGAEAKTDVGGPSGLGVVVARLIMGLAIVVKAGDVPIEPETRTQTHALSTPLQAAVALKAHLTPEQTELFLLRSGGHVPLLQTSAMSHGPAAGRQTVPSSDGRVHNNIDEF